MPRCLRVSGDARCCTAPTEATGSRCRRLQERPSGSSVARQRCFLRQFQTVHFCPQRVAVAALKAPAPSISRAAAEPAAAAQTNVNTLRGTRLSTERERSAQITRYQTRRAASQPLYRIATVSSAELADHPVPCFTPQLPCRVAAATPPAMRAYCEPPAIGRTLCHCTNAC
jgi:hypothetical protein